MHFMEAKIQRHNQVGAELLEKAEQTLDSSAGFASIEARLMHGKVFDFKQPLTIEKKAKPTPQKRAPMARFVTREVDLVRTNTNTDNNNEELTKSGEMIATDATKSLEETGNFASNKSSDDVRAPETGGAERSGEPLPPEGAEVSSERKSKPRAGTAPPSVAREGDGLQYLPDFDEEEAQESRSGRPCPWSPDSGADEYSALADLNKKRQQVERQRAPTLPASWLPSMNRPES